MKKFVLMFAVVVLFAGSQAYAEQEATSAAPAVVAAEGTGEEKVDVGNLICPVGGEEISKMGNGTGYAVEHNGKIYHLCCEMCLKDFQADPEKYTKIAEEEVAKREAEAQGVAE
ncbi:MAG: TRASH domain-containing protein [Candidatus Omnitrophica bacterium]|nr:TRASH domain-containing protein [Candidatus Omnitrophota bacterium]